MMLCPLLLLLISKAAGPVDAFSGNGVKARSFVFSPPKKTSDGGGSDKPKLVIISGAPGTGKSTFGMSVSLDGAGGTLVYRIKSFLWLTVASCLSFSGRSGPGHPKMHFDRHCAGRDAIVHSSANQPGPAPIELRPGYRKRRPGSELARDLYCVRVQCCRTCR